MIIKELSYMIKCDKCHDYLYKYDTFEQIREGTSEHIIEVAKIKGWSILEDMLCSKCKEKLVTSDNSDYRQAYGHCKQRTKK